MSVFKHYKRKGLSEMRPYVVGESMDGVSISDADKLLPTLEGGFIARNPANHDDKWYISKEYHEANLEEALEIAEEAVEAVKVFGLTFGQAISALKNGKKVERSGWNGKGMFLYYVPANSYPASGNTLGTMKGVFENDMVPYGAYIAMKTAQNNVVPWLASQTDVLADDWQIVE